MGWISGEPATHWQGAVSDNSTTRKRALSYWSRHLDVLPGPIFFTLTQEQLLRGEWQRIVRNSEQRCDCGERRWFIPTHSRGFYAPAPPDLVHLSPGSRQLAIGPWGGDVQATSLQLSVEDDDLVMRNMPYSHLTRDQLALLGLKTLEDVERTDESVSGKATRGDQNTITLADCAAQLAEGVSPLGIESGIRVGAPDSTDVFLYQMFGVYEVDLDSKTLTVAVGMNCQRMDPSMRGEMHVC